jgi:hypothetical protein
MHWWWQQLPAFILLLWSICSALNGCEPMLITIAVKTCGTKRYQTGHGPYYSYFSHNITQNRTSFEGCKLTAVPKLPATF